MTIIAAEYLRLKPEQVKFEKRQYDLPLHAAKERLAARESHDR